MNPNENNPMSPVGAGGALGGPVPVPGAGGSVDFTNSTNLDNGAMGDGAAAGASGNAGGVAPAMPPLTPAEPVPGSIGSVTSVPPLAPEPMDMSALNNSAATSNMPVMGQAPEAKAGGEKPVNESPYYNPFVRNNVSTGGVEEKPAAAAPTSSATVPPVLQPQTDKFSDRLDGAKKPEKKQGNTMMLLGWLLAVLFFVTTVVFIVLWQGEANKKPEVVYYPSGSEDKDDEPEEPEGPTEPVALTLTCTQNLGSVVEGLEGLVDHNRTVQANYIDGDLSGIMSATAYNFVDGPAAEAARPYFDGQVIADVTRGGFEISENILTYSSVADKESLNIDYANAFGLSVNEAGEIDTTVDGVKAALETAGMVCSEE